MEKREKWFTPGQYSSLKHSHSIRTCHPHMRGTHLLSSTSRPPPSSCPRPATNSHSPPSPLFKPQISFSRQLKPYFSLSSSSDSTPSLPDSMVNSLREDDVGISCYISPHRGFRGVLKHRYADFIVNEVDCEGNIVHLTSFDVPEESMQVEEKEKSIEDSDFSGVLQAFLSVTGEEDAEVLRGFLARISSGVINDNAFILLSPDSDKAHRTEVHRFFKDNLRFLITDVVEVPSSDVKSVRVRFSSGGMGRTNKKRKSMDENYSKEDQRFDSRGSKTWPSHLGKFLRFNLYKENKDTQEALGVIGKMLGIQQKSFGFAGTKDKRAITTQRVTVFKQHAKRMASLNDRLIGMKVGNFCHVEEGLVLGKLSGNHFTIVLRDVLADSDDDIKAATESLKRKGFINYFGLQRFGSGFVPTHVVGAALLRGEWKAAVGLILDPRDGERADIREAREYYKESGDVDGILKKLPRFLVAERAVLQCLKKCPGNYLQALKAIPRTLRMMYVHSYQSYLWNHAASMRVKKYGVGQVVLGDLVVISRPEFVEVPDISCSDVNSDDDHAADDDLISPSDNATRVKVIEDADLAEGDYTIADVVLPLPGSKVLYPDNEIASIYHELAEKESIDHFFVRAQREIDKELAQKKDCINLTETAHAAKEFSITSMNGGYRRVFQCPSDFTWELVSYTDEDKPLAETDFEAMSRKWAESNEKDSSCSLEGSELVAPQSRMALKLGFTLPASCYATMAIRELMKSSTSFIPNGKIEGLTRSLKLMRDTSDNQRKGFASIMGTDKEGHGRKISLTLK